MIFTSLPTSGTFDWLVSEKVARTLIIQGAKGRPRALASARRGLPAASIW